MMGLHLHWEAVMYNILILLGQCGPVVMVLVVRRMSFTAAVDR
jgi:hypothetical protein